MLNVILEEIAGLKTAVKAMRNPMNSWDKSDSVVCTEFCTADVCHNCQFNEDEGDGCTTFCHNDGDEPVFVLGNDDLNLMQKLFNAGVEHRTY